MTTPNEEHAAEAPAVAAEAPAAEAGVPAEGMGSPTPRSTPRSTGRAEIADGLLVETCVHADHLDRREDVVHETGG